MSKQAKIALGVFIAAIICTCATMRAPLTSVGAIATTISQALDLPGVAVGLLTTIPLIAFAASSVFLSKIAERFGKTKVLLVGCILALAGIVIRSLPGTAMLFAGTILLGLGISCGNVLIPAVIKERTPARIGLMTSLYTAMMSIFSGVFAGISSNMAADGVDWQVILSITIPLAVGAIVLWAVYRRLPGGREEMAAKDADGAPTSTTPEPQSSGNSTTTSASKDAGAAGRNTRQPSGSSGRSVFRIPLAWWISGAMGIQSVLFYCCVAWLPSMLAQTGMASADISLCITIFQILGIPSNIVVPIICSKLKRQRAFGAAIGISLVFGFALLLLTNNAVSGYIAVVILGASQGASFSIVLLFFGLRTTDGNAAAELSGMAQGLGYVLAAIGPTLMGALFDMSGSWTSSILLMAALSLAYGICAWKSGDGIVK